MDNNYSNTRPKITILLVLVFVVILSSCIEEERLPYVVTIEADSIKYNSAVCGGYVSENAGPPVIAKGICWGLSSKPTISGNHTSNGDGAIFFTARITGLEHNTIYHVRAYGENQYGISYGNEISFTTLYDPNAHWLPGDDWIDPRDGQSYGTVKIGEQVWISENLNFYTSSESLYYDYDSINNSEQYGRLYTINIASQACPEGWHLPSDEEWQCLEIALGMNELQATFFGWRGTDQGSQLITGGESGFNADLSGYGYSTGSSNPGQIIFSGLGNSAWFWTSTNINKTSPGVNTDQIIRILNIDNSKVNRDILSDYRYKNYLSLRCIKDQEHITTQ